MGWPEDVLLNMSMPYIESAYRGRIKMLQAIFGTSKPAAPVPDNGPSLFKDLKRLALKQRRPQRKGG